MDKCYKTRGLRGATTVEEDSSSEIGKATIELLKRMLAENKILEDDIASVIFTLTHDLTAEFPAKIARLELNWDDIPMICTQEVPVPGSLPMCIRVLILVNTTLEKNEIRHMYMRGARKLRPDLAVN
jgi:chorismate mutase